MTNNEIKKVFLNSILAGALCTNMTACDKVYVTDEKETTTSKTINYACPEDTILDGETCIVTGDSTTIKFACPEGYIKEGSVCKKITASTIMNKVEEFNKYIETQTVEISNQVKEDFDKYDSSNTLSYIYLLNKDFIDDEVRDELYEYGLSKDINELKTQYDYVIMHIAYLNGFYSLYSYTKDVETKADSYISLSNFILSDEYEMDIYKLDRQLYSESKYDPNTRSVLYKEGNKLCDFDIKNHDSITDHTIYMTYSNSNLVYFLTELEDEEIQKNQNNYDEEINYVINELVNKDYLKTKILTK